MTTNESKGIYVLETTKSSRSCGTSSPCTNLFENDKKKIEGNCILGTGASPLRDRNGNVLGWNYNYFISCEIKSRKKNFWGSWVNHPVTIEWRTGYGIACSDGSINHGTGWTQQNASSIGYFYSWFGQGFVSGWAGVQALWIHFTSYSNYYGNNTDNEDCYAGC